MVWLGSPLLWNGGLPCGGRHAAAAAAGAQRRESAVRMDHSCRRSRTGSAVRARGALRVHRQATTVAPCFLSPCGAFVVLSLSLLCITLNLGRACAQRSQGATAVCLAPAGELGLQDRCAFAFSAVCAAWPSVRPSRPCHFPTPPFSHQTPLTKACVLLLTGTGS